MPVKVLVADESLDVHELVNDILLINFKDVAVDRVMEAEGFRTMLGTNRPGYNLIIIGSGLVDASGKSAVSVLCDEFPQYRGIVVILQDEAGQVPDTPMIKKIPVLAKPFSLDEFSDRITKICPR
jgi:DNA-binding response OmpR family regulator